MTPRRARALASAALAFGFFAPAPALAEDPAFAKDLGLPGEYAVEQAPTLGPDGAGFDLYCPVTSGVRDAVLVVHELGKSAASARNLARHIASFGVPVVVADLSGADAKTAADRLQKARAALPQAVLGLTEGAPCARLKTCGASSGGSECDQWSAPRVGGLVVVGSGAAVYLELLRKTACAHDGSVVLLDPDFGESPPKLDGCYGGEITLLLADSRACRADESDVLDGSLDGFGAEVLTLFHTNHCDASDDASAVCAARCGASTPDGRSHFRRYLMGYLLGYAREAQGWENRWIYDHPAEIEYAYRTASKSSAVLGFNASLVFGIGARDSDHDDLRVKGVGALRPEFIFGRTSARSWGAGPYLEAGWLATSSLSLGGGASILAPIGRASAIVPSLGAFAHRRDDAWRAGGAFGLFIGGREFNDISSFDASHGLRVEARADFDAHGERAVYLAYQADLTAVLALAALGGGMD